MVEEKYEGTSTQWIDRQLGEPDRTKNRKFVKLFEMKKAYSLDDIRNILSQNNILKRPNTLIGKAKLRILLKLRYPVNYWKVYHFQKRIDKMTHSIVYNLNWYDKVGWC